MKLSSAFSFFFSFVFLVQSTAWATGETTLESKAQLAEIVEEINSLSKKERAISFNHYLKTLPESDQKALKKQVGDVTKINLPKLDIEENGIVFLYDGNKYSIVPGTKSTFTIKNQKYDFSPGKIPQTLQKLEAALSKKSASILDYFISSAYAGIPAEGIVGIIGVLAFIVGMVTMGTVILVAGAVLAFGGGIGSLVHNVTTNQIIKFCDELRSKADNYSDESSEADIKRLIVEIKRAQTDMKDHPGCKRRSRRDTCNQIKNCLDGLEQEAGGYLNSVNQSGRGQVKDLNQSSPQVPEKESASDQ